jgi:hypothetical protein
MKTILFVFALACNILISCYHGTEDGKEAYSNYDTTKPTEHINTQDSNINNSTLKDNAIDKN